jgi:hypothetical protein
LTVERTHPSCYEFNDVSITLTSQCEYDADVRPRPSIVRKDGAAASA